jgi:hypothetical protein
MTTTASPTALRELDARTNDGLDIRLLWRPHDDVVLLQVDDAELHLRLVVPVAPDDAMFAFHHPFAFAETAKAAEQGVPRRDPLTGARRPWVNGR